MTPAVQDPVIAETALFRTRARAMSVVALETVYDRMMDLETPLKLQMEFVDLCAKLADLHPKAAQPVLSPGAGVTVTINLGAPDNPKEVTVDAVVAEEELGLSPWESASRMLSDGFVSVPADVVEANMDLAYSE